MIRLPSVSVKKVLWSVGSLGLIVLLGFTGHEQQLQRCKGLRIRVTDQTGHYFIEPKDVLEVLNTKAGKVKGALMQDINTALLEKIVYSNPFIGKAEVYSTIDGFVNIDVWQRNPVIRIVNNDNEHFYIDEQGDFMPVTDKYSCQVIVASGHIYDDYAERSLRYAVPFIKDTTMKPVLFQLNEIALFLKQHEFWDAQIEQLYVNDRSEIELIPRIGNQTILLGSSENLEEKMDRLMLFYREGIIKAGWNKYSVINLKYKDQVICTRAADGGTKKDKQLH
jgi:cell division protein FtsQ